MKPNLKFSGLAKSLLLLGAATTSLLIFQNCNTSKVASTQSDALSTATAPPVVTPPVLTVPTAPGAIVRGYQFSGEYRPAATDLSGIKLCRYPSLANCQTDADGKSKGRAFFENTPLNPASSLHVMKFEFISNGFLGKNTSAHFAMGLRGRVTTDANKDPVAINGRGFIIGYLGGHPNNAGNPACVTRHGQIETYHGDANLADSTIPGNYVFSESCTDTIFQDGQLYKIEIYVSRDRKIGFKIFDANSKIIHSYLKQDPTNHINLELNQWFIGHVFDSPITNTAGNWNFIIQNIQFAESNAAIEGFFVQKIVAFQYGTQLVADNTVYQLADVKTNGLSIGDYAPARTRVFGCANPTNLVDAGTSCQNPADFRVINFSGDDSFQKVGSRLKIIPASIDPFPANTYKLLLRLNPFDSQNQNSIQVVRP